MEFQIQDRLSFMRFLGLGLGDQVPDAKTIWLFREHLVQAGAVENLFARFDKHLAKAGYLAMGGQIVDATVVAAPKQRNTGYGKADIKAGKIPDAWKDKPAKLRQKDRDARWTVKFSKAKVDDEGKQHKRDIAVPVFGYKNHAAIDQRHGFIRGWTVTHAAAYDGAQLRNVVKRPSTGSTVWAAYRACLRSPEGQDGPVRQTIGIARATMKIGMANLAYNITRYVWHEKKAAAA